MKLEDFKVRLEHEWEVFEGEEVQVYIFLSRIWKGSTSWGAASKSILTSATHPRGEPRTSGTELKRGSD